MYILKHLLGGRHSVGDIAVNNSEHSICPHGVSSLEQKEGFLKNTEIHNCKMWLSATKEKYGLLRIQETTCFTLED